MRINIYDFEIISDNERTIPVVMKGRPRKILSRQYRKCKADLILMMKSQIEEDFKPLVRARVNITAVTAKDLTNLFKILLDSLQGAKILKTDDIMEIHARKIPKAKGSLEDIEIYLEGE